MGKPWCWWGWARRIAASNRCSTRAADSTRANPYWAHQPDPFGERQRIGGPGHQRFGQLGEVGGDQGQRDRLRPQIGGQGQQHQRSRRLGSQPVKSDLDAGRQRHRIGRRSALGQQLRSPPGQQSEIVLHAGGGVGQVRPSQRQRQVPQFLRDAPRLTGGQLRGVQTQQLDALSKISSHRSRSRNTPSNRAAAVGSVTAA
jgi:hypothetical protein